MESAQQYLQQAEQCEQQAAEASLASSREALLSTAAIWRKLAASAQQAGECIFERGINTLHGKS